MCASPYIFQYFGILTPCPPQFSFLLCSPCGADTGGPTTPSRLHTLSRQDVIGKVSGREAVFEMQKSCVKTLETPAGCCV